MIRVGPLSRARLRAACYALRVRWVEELERQRDEAVRDHDNVREAFTLMSGLKETVEAQHQLAIAQRDGARAHASHWRREIAELLEVQAEGMTDGELLGGLKTRFGGGGPGTVLDAWRQVCRLIDDQEGFLSPASIVDRVALLIARQTADELPREAYDPAMGGDIEPPPGRPAPVSPDDLQAAREAAHGVVVNAGFSRATADEVVDGLVRAGVVPGAYPPGMTVDGDMLDGVIREALPDEWTDDACRTTADHILDHAVKSGFTVLHGPDLQPRPPHVPREALSGDVPW